jgi:hypothetical protein
MFLSKLAEELGLGFVLNDATIKHRVIASLINGG